MVKQYARNEVASRLQATLAAGKAIMMAGAGNGLSAKCAELGGIDLIVIYNSGKFRMDGLPSIAGLMPYGNANDIVLELGERHVFPAVKDTPVLAGVCGTDPTRNMRQFLEHVRDVGFSGVINYPTVSRFDGNIRRDLESVGLGFAREVEMIALARETGLYTTCYVRTPEESRQMAEAGVDLIVPHVGLTTGGTIGAGHALPMDEAVKATQAMIDAARAVNPNVIALAHGGPFEGPEQVAYVLERSDAQGFVGASSFERLPVEQAIVGLVKEFKKLRVDVNKHNRAG
ncbi:MAG: phosphoenolpyruvate hydrolase family protein [Candidatus Korobacteraceae bacterium]|jgi:predicted TIM-barrel enzyme